MIDERAFRTTHNEVNETPCIFAKGILSRCCACPASRKLLIAEREAIACRSPGGHSQCAELHDRLRENALFALRLTGEAGPLPHGKEMKIQCGGLAGIAARLSGATRDDIQALLRLAVDSFGTLDRLPFSEIVRDIAAYQPRPRRRS